VSVAISRRSLLKIIDGKQQLSSGFPTITTDCMKQNLWFFLGCSDHISRKAWIAASFLAYHPSYPD
jgi:hypothetical protein